MYSKSQKTGLTLDTATDNGTTNGDENDANNSEGGAGTNFTKAIQNDPIIVGLNQLFEEMNEEIMNTGQERIGYLNRMYKKAKKMEGGSVGSKEDEANNLEDRNPDKLIGQADQLRELLDHVENQDAKTLDGQAHLTKEGFEFAD
jgi:hypothetical protein